MPKPLLGKDFTIKQLSSQNKSSAKGKKLPEVLGALTDMGARDEVKALLPLCSWAMTTAVELL
ncbi:MAG: hypothetical protein NZ937_01325 [Armatimonadetes bacterium]|nr:hypothetical protein [Armatimonadota bacterium]